jgi:short-subunit dehydrogenase
VGGAPAHVDFDPREPFVSHADLQIGGLGHDRAVCGPSRNQGICADTREFLVHHCRDDEAPFAESTLSGRTRSVNHRGDTTLHVLRATGVQAAIALDRVERRVHALHADRIEMSAEHQRATALVRVEDADHIWPAGRSLLQFDVQPDATHVLRDGGGDLPLPCRARHERGIHGVDCDEVAQEGNSWIHLSRAPNGERRRLYHADMSLAGRVATITGASSGIGLACAQHFARAGISVVLAARRGDRLEQAVAAIRNSGGTAEAVTADVTSEADVQRVVTRAQEAFGGLDIMVCNAGFGYYGMVEETPPDVMQRMMDVNFMGTYLGARAALPVFRRHRRGHLMIVSSIVGRRGIPLMSGYSATKAAQVAFAESLRGEFSGTDIHVSVVFPVSTETEFRSTMERDYGQAISGLGPRQSADVVARAMVECVERPRPEVYPHPVSRALTVVNVVAPGITDRFVRKYARRRATPA